MCAHAREGGEPVKAEDKADEGVGASRLVRCSSFSLWEWIKDAWAPSDEPVHKVLKACIVVWLVVLAPKLALIVKLICTILSD